jgi:hypothetical protein
MVTWKKPERESGRFLKELNLKELNIDEIYDRLDSIRGFLKGPRRPFRQENEPRMGSHARPRGRHGR